MVHFPLVNRCQTTTSLRGLSHLDESFYALFVKSCLDHFTFHCASFQHSFLTLAHSKSFCSMLIALNFAGTSQSLQKGTESDGVLGVMEQISQFSFEFEVSVYSPLDDIHKSPLLGHIVCVFYVSIVPVVT